MRRFGPATGRRHVLALLLNVAASGSLVVMEETVSPFFEREIAQIIKSVAWTG